MTQLEMRVAERTAELEAANILLRDSRRAALNMMEDAEAARRKAEAMSVELRHESNERKQAEEQIRAMNDDLERMVEQRTRELQETQSQYLHAEKLAAIGKLSASIAHEFNNPLQGIMSILKGLKKRAIIDEEDRELLEAAIVESDRMKNLIRSLQDFNRPSSGRKTHDGRAKVHRFPAVVEQERFQEQTDFRSTGAMPSICRRSWRCRTRSNRSFSIF